MGLTPGILVVYILLEVVLALTVIIFEFAVKKKTVKNKNNKN